MKYLTDNTRITGLMEVSPPVDVIGNLPITEKVSELVFNSRREISDILHGDEDRLVVVVGPCSIHDPKAAIEYAKKMEEYGAGELLVTSMDRDGTQVGYDIELMSKISSKVNIPVIASGGVGNLDHLVEGIKLGKASAVLAASIFHYGKHSIKEAKEYLDSKGIPVRI